MEETTSLLDSSSSTSPPVQRRNKKPISAYYVILTIVFVVLFLDCIVSLGCFGETQRKLSHLEENNSTKCILFGSYVGERSDGTTEIRLSHVGTCAFVLWGQVSIVVVSFVWIVYSVFLAVIAPKILSVLRILDFLVMGIAFLLSFALGVTVSAGLSKTCSAHGKSISCALNYLVHSGSDEKFFYYVGVHAAQSSLWVACVFFLGIAIFNFILVVVMCLRMKKRRRLAAQIQDEDVSQASNTSNYLEKPNK